MFHIAGGSGAYPNPKIDLSTKYSNIQVVCIRIICGDLPGLHNNWETMSNFMKKLKPWCIKN